MSIKVANSNIELHTKDSNTNSEISLGDLNQQNQALLYKHFYNDSNFKRNVLAFFVLVIVINFFCNLSLLIANCQPQDVIEENYYLPFHLLDFWGAFLFALSEGSVLVITGQVTLDSFKIYLILINIGGTLIALILFTFDPEFFEVLSHWIEYSVQLLITLTDFIFIFQQDKTSIMYRYRYYETFIVILTFIMNFLKLLVYGEVIPTDSGERSAHFLEYSGEMINDCFAIFFIIIQLNIEQKNIMEVMKLKIEVLLEKIGYQKIN